MKRFIIFLSLLCLVLSSPSMASAGEEYARTMKQDLLCLMLAYPEYVEGIEKDEKGCVYVRMKTGKKIIYDDKESKTAAEKLNRADLQDTLQEAYPLGGRTVLMENNRDPGRYRCYELLNQVYGGNRSVIEKRLKSTSFAYESILFNSTNNAAAALEKTGLKLASLMKEPRIFKAIYPGSGTYNYRVIAGTSNLSPHAYGIAIDLARDPRDYWQWAAREAGAKRLKDYPSEVVEAFEENGFIWGGKWWHFDILHYEYRPEIILKAQFFGVSTDGEWYQGASLENSWVGECVQKINNALD